MIKTDGRPTIAWMLVIPQTVKVSGGDEATALAADEAALAPTGAKPLSQRAKP